MKFTKNEFIRFLFFGSVNTVATYLIYALFLRIFPYLVSYSVSYLLGICLSYYLNSRFVFYRNLDVRKAFQFPLVYVNQYVLGALLLYFFVEVLDINKLIAPGLIIVLTVPISYFFSRLIIKGGSSGKSGPSNDREGIDQAMSHESESADSSHELTDNIEETHGA